VNHFSDVAIVGAGPYGLSLAAHLRPTRLSLRIFGCPMQTWRQHMPQGMALKSDGFASSLSDPTRSFTLGHFCAEQGIPYHDAKVPVSLETFVAYGVAFQKRFVPDLEETQVRAIKKNAAGYCLRLANGNEAHARNVILAVGITHFGYVPAELSGLPGGFVSHSSAYGPVEHLRGKKVTIVGAGASAADLAAALQEQRIDVTIVARQPIFRFHDRPGVVLRSLWYRIRRPSSGLGPGLTSRFYADLPGLFRYLPQDLRLRVVRTALGPAGSWVVKERIVDHVPMLLGRSIRRTEVIDGQIHLLLSAQDGSQTEYVTDHVIAATGYRMDLRRLTFLSDEIRSRLRALEHTPILSKNFESSLPGLFFVGMAAANTFGPVLRFVFGTQFTARRVTSALHDRGRG